MLIFIVVGIIQGCGALWDPQLPLLLSAALLKNDDFIQSKYDIGFRI